MCDDHCCNSHTQTSFYHHYLNQHRIMTQFFWKLHQGNFNQTSVCDCVNYRPQFYNYRPRPSFDTSTSESSTSESSSSSSEYEVEQEDSPEINEDGDSSEYEYELNVDAILAMRAAKEELSKSSTSESESIVMINSDNEDFEMVELGSYKTLTSELARHVGNDVNMNKEFEARKKIMEYLYGEKSATIGGLETAMAVNFEHLCDTHQPSLWPVLPVRL